MGSGKVDFLTFGDSVRPFWPTRVAGSFVFRHLLSTNFRRKSSWRVPTSLPSINAAASFSCSSIGGPGQPPSPCPAGPTPSLPGSAPASDIPEKHAEKHQRRRCWEGVGGARATKKCRSAKIGLRKFDRKLSCLTLFGI